MDIWRYSAVIASIKAYGIVLAMASRPPGCMSSSSEPVLCLNSLEKFMWANFCSIINETTWQRPAASAGQQWCSLCMGSVPFWQFNQQQEVHAPPGTNLNGEEYNIHNELGTWRGSPRCTGLMLQSSASGHASHCTLIVVIMKRLHVPCLTQHTHTFST